MLRHARFVIPTLLLIGCGGGSAAHKDGGAATDGGLGGLGGSTGTGGLTGGAGSGIAGAAMPTGSLVFTGSMASLLTQGPPCSGEVGGVDGGTGDRWCAFVAASVSTPGNGDLFVLNVSKAAAGMSITCGLTDPNCLLLTSNFGQNDLHPAFFGGDTLVYYDLMGQPFAWRPGMTAGRMLAMADPTTLDVVLCTPALKGTGVFCLRDLPTAMQTDPAILLSDLLVGRVDGAATPPLAKVETVISASSADTKVIHFEVDFPTADTIAWSARSAKGAAEVLKMQTIGDDASRAMIATGINAWSTSPDGTRWYWLSAVSETTGAGALQSAPFPAGTSPVMITPSVLQYGFPTPTSLLTVDTTTTKQMLTFADPVGAPTTSTPVDTSVLGWISLSSQGHVAYVKKTFTNAAGKLTGIDLSVKKSDGTGACVLTSATDAYPGDIHFTPGAVGLSWIQQATGSAAGQFTRLSDCMKMAVASPIVWVEPIGERALLYIDTFDSVSGTAYMRFKNAPAGAISSDPATQISAQVGSFSVTSAASSDVVLYTVNGGSNDDGVYVRSFGP